MIFVLFDIDGTILHSNHVDGKCYGQAYKDVFGFDMLSTDWGEYPHVTDTSILDTCFQKHFGRTYTFEEETQIVNRLTELFRQNRITSPELFNQIPNVTRTIERLLEDGRFIVGIATGGWKAPAMFKLDHAKVPVEQLHKAFSDNNVSREDILNEALDKAHAAHPNITRTVYIGDGIWDARTTRNMNLPFIGIRIDGDVEVLHEEGTNHVFTDYQDYNAFLEAIFTATVPVEVKSEK